MKFQNKIVKRSADINFQTCKILVKWSDSKKFSIEHNILNKYPDEIFNHLTDQFQSHYGAFVRQQDASTVDPWRVTVTYVSTDKFTITDIWHSISNGVSITDLNQCSVNSCIVPLN